MIWLILLILTWPIFMGVVYYLIEKTKLPECKELKAFFTCLWPIGVFVLSLYLIFVVFKCLYINISFFVDHYIIEKHLDEG